MFGVTERGVVSLNSSIKAFVGVTMEAMFELVPMISMSHSSSMGLVVVYRSVYVVEEDKSFRLK